MCSISMGHVRPGKLWNGSLQFHFTGLQSHVHHERSWKMMLTVGNNNLGHCFIFLEKKI